MIFIQAFVAARLDAHDEHWSGPWGTAWPHSRGLARAPATLSNPYGLNTCLRSAASAIGRAHSRCTRLPECGYRSRVLPTQKFGRPAVGFVIPYLARESRYACIPGTRTLLIALLSVPGGWSCSVLAFDAHSSRTAVQALCDTERALRTWSLRHGHQSTTIDHAIVFEWLSGPNCVGADVQGRSQVHVHRLAQLLTEHLRNRRPPTSTQNTKGSRIFCIASVALLYETPILPLARCSPPRWHVLNTLCTGAQSTIKGAAK